MGIERRLIKPFKNNELGCVLQQCNKNEMIWNVTKH